MRSQADTALPLTDNATLMRFRGRDVLEKVACADGRSRTCAWTGVLSSTCGFASSPDLSHDLVNLVRGQVKRFPGQLRPPFHEDSPFACLLQLMIRLIHKLLDNRFPLFKNHWLFLPDLGQLDRTRSRLAMRGSPSSSFGFVFWLACCLLAVV